METKFPRMIEHEVPCCSCGATGRVKKWLRTKDCKLCEGTGQRKVYVAENLTEADRRAVLAVAEHGTLMGSRISLPRFVPY